MKKLKFKRKYILGEGYPWAIGFGKYLQVSMCKKKSGVNMIELNWPAELWSQDIPKYRLVLEKVKEEGNELPKDS